VDVKDITCPSCEAKTLRPVSHSLTVEHQGKEVRVDGLEGCLCTTCGADPVLMPQIRANQIRIADAKRASAGLLSGAQIKSIRDKLRLSQSEAAEIFGGGANAFSKYERGEVVQGASIDKLLRAAREFPRLIDFLKGGTAEIGAISTIGTAITLPTGDLASWTFEAIGAGVSAHYIVETSWNSVDTNACANDDHMLLVRMA
jgi:HTH-type transcriptional regulator / antitoxin MqsA